MDTTAISQKVKEIISNVANIPVDEIGDEDAFVDDLQLDSLSLLEIGVDVDYEERLQKLRTVKETVDLVLAESGKSAEKNAAQAA